MTVTPPSVIFKFDEEALQNVTPLAQPVELVMRMQSASIRPFTVSFFKKY